MSSTNKKVTWKGNKLYDGTKSTKYGIVPAKFFGAFKMYRYYNIERKFSGDMYNKARAKENAKEEYLKKKEELCLMKDS